MSSRKLRNMSVAPKTTISHQGAGLGLRLIVDLPMPLAQPTAEAVLNLIGQLPRSLRTLSSDEALNRVIELAIENLDLPAAAPVRRDVDVPPDRVRTCTDLTAIIAILAKSSDRLYLRDKAPIVSGIQSGRRLVLVLPDGCDWSR